MEWDPDARIEELAMEAALDDGNEAKAAERVFRENAVLAAHSITHLAAYGTNERIRLDAAKYVVERNLGKLTNEGDAAEKDPWDDILKEVVKSSAEGSSSDGGLDGK